MDSNDLKFSEGESVIKSYMGLSLTNKRVFRLSKKFYDCIFLDKLDSIEFLKISSPILLIIGIVLIILGFIPMFMGVPNSVLFCILGIILGIFFIIAYNFSKRQFLKIKSSNNVINLFEKGNEFLLAQDFINNIVKAKEEYVKSMK